MTERGVTFLEMLVTVVIILVLASVAFPLSKHTSKRAKEIELRQKLRELRTAIDEFRRDWARDGDILYGPLCVKNRTACKQYTGVSGYPKSLKVLLRVELTGAESTVRENIAVRRYLRRIPIDPMTGTADWALRCTQDEADVQHWCGEDVFDVSSKSEDLAIDHTRYRDW